MNKKKVFFRSDILVVALKGALTKFHPRDQIRNAVMFSVFVGALLTTGLFGLSLTGLVSDGPRAFIGAITLWLWFTLIFSNFSEALAEGRGKAQALALKKTRSVVHGRKLSAPEWESVQTETISTSLQKGDLVLVEAGELIPADGEVLKGAASVDESAITGESAPVIRESGGDRSSVTGGTRVLSDRLIIRITQDPGRGFLDKMISLVEGAARQRTPNEVALSILLAALSLVFLVVSATLLPLSELSQILGGGGLP